MDGNLTQRLGRVLVIGGGKMGEALVSAFLSLPGMHPDCIVVADHGKEKCRRLTSAYGVSCFEDAALAPHAETVVLAVKPQTIADVTAKAVVDGVFADCHLVISIAAGITTASLEELIPSPSAVVRVMPNMPLMCGCGAAAVSAGSRPTNQQVQTVLDVFRAAGGAVEVPENLQGVATAISGNGPAYFALLIDELSKVGQLNGLTCETAYALALDTMTGTARLLNEGSLDAAQLITAVSSPGGTTEAAVAEMRRQGIGDAIAAGVKAAIRRSEELSR